MLDEKMKNENQQRRAIISMIAFFDLFKYPLSPFEIWNNFSVSLSLGKVYGILKQELRTSNLLREKNGFYFLNGRQEIVAIRQARYNYAQRKIKIARRFTRLFSFFPGVKVVCLVNLIGAYNLRDGSDIDFLIITSPRRIWLSRLYCTGLAKILNSRPNSKTKRDKICLSFYLSSDHLSLTTLRLKNKDPYFDYWYKGLFLLYNSKEDFYEKFLEINSNFSFKNNYSELAGEIKNEQLNFIKKNWITTSGDFLEKQAKKFQLKIMPLNLKHAANDSEGVVISDQILKFYQDDRRLEYAKKYETKIKKIFGDNN